MAVSGETGSRDASSAVNEKDESVTTVSKPGQDINDEGSQNRSEPEPTLSVDEFAHPTEEPAGQSTADDADLLPKVAPHDSAQTWGDSRGNHGHDEWLRENKPPHWG